MRKTFRLQIFIAFMAGVLNITTVNAQDTIKKPTVVTGTAVKASNAKPVATAAKPVVSGIPINPKTGRPYSKWGFGTNAKAYQAQKEDSAQKATTAIQPTTPAVVDKSLNGQYQALLTKVYNYQQPFVAAFWKSVRDSLNNSRQQLKAANEKLAANTQSVTELQNTVAARETELSKAESVDFLGISFSKNGYSAMMWGLVLVLGAVAAFVIFRSGSARSEAAYRTKLYSELEEEYKAYKAKANEKEKKLARELQTERNKVDELLGRG